mgnify:FL=1
MSASLEEYLKIMLVLYKKNGYIRVTDIAKEMSCSKPSVNRALKILKETGYIDYEVYGKILLTKKGENEASHILRRHEILKAFLIQVLDVKEEVAKVEANNMKHAISENTASKLEEYIKSIIDVSNLECDYNPDNEKCRNCIKVTAKFRLDKNLKR